MGNSSSSESDSSTDQNTQPRFMSTQTAEQRARVALLLRRAGDRSSQPPNRPARASRSSRSSVGVAHSVLSSGDSAEGYVSQNAIDDTSRTCSGAVCASRSVASSGVQTPVTSSPHPTTEARVAARSALRTTPKSRGLNRRVTFDESSITRGQNRDASMQQRSGSGLGEATPLDRLLQRVDALSVQIEDLSLLSNVAHDVYKTTAASEERSLRTSGAGETKSSQAQAESGELQSPASQYTGSRYWEMVTRSLQNDQASAQYEVRQTMAHAEALSQLPQPAAASQAPLASSSRHAAVVGGEQQQTVDALPADQPSAIETPATASASAHSAPQLGRPSSGDTVVAAAAAPGLVTHDQPGWRLRATPIPIMPESRKAIAVKGHCDYGYANKAVAGESGPPVCHSPSSSAPTPAAPSPAVRSRRLLKQARRRDEKHQRLEADGRSALLTALGYSTSLPQNAPLGAAEAASDPQSRGEGRSAADRQQSQASALPKPRPRPSLLLSHSYPVGTAAAGVQSRTTTSMVTQSRHRDAATARSEKAMMASATSIEPQKRQQPYKPQRPAPPPPRRRETTSRCMQPPDKAHADQAQQADKRAAVGRDDPPQSNTYRFGRRWNTAKSAYSVRWSNAAAARQPQPHSVFSGDPWTCDFAAETAALSPPQPLRAFGGDAAAALPEEEDWQRDRELRSIQYQQYDDDLRWRADEVAPASFSGKFQHDACVSVEASAVPVVRQSTTSATVGVSSTADTAACRGASGDANRKGGGADRRTAEKASSSLPLCGRLHPNAKYYGSRPAVPK